MPGPKLPLPHYHAFLVRLWREGHGRPWHATAQSATTHQVHHFPSVEALYAFLDTHLTADANEPAPRGLRDPPLDDDEKMSP